MSNFITVKKYEKLDGTTLKIIACISMFIDHFGYICFPGNIALRIVGRLAFPIYCFLLVEGVMHTHDIRRYMFRMFVFALISELPFDIAFYHHLVYPFHQNVFFTLVLGLITICLIRHRLFKNKVLQAIYGIAVVMLMGILANTFYVDYYIYGIVCMAAFYVFRDSKWKKCLASSLSLGIMGGIEWFAAFAVIPIVMYNGRRGKQTKVMQYGFYIFYPVHLLILAAVHVFFF